MSRVTPEGFLVRMFRRAFPRPRYATGLSRRARRQSARVRAGDAVGAFSWLSGPRVLARMPLPWSDRGVPGSAATGWLAPPGAGSRRSGAAPMFSGGRPAPVIRGEVFFHRYRLDPDAYREIADRPGAPGRGDPADRADRRA